MKITVILCTYNRYEALGRALESVAKSVVPEPIRWEVLIVDNNSDDRTKAVAQGFIEKHPGRFRYLFEPKAGKSYALNSGVQESDGDVLAFMDDDVPVEPTWLERITGPMSDQIYAGTGGPILPGGDFSPPSWLSESGPYALAPFALFAPRSDAGELKEAPFGTNMAFRRIVFEKYGGFRTDLGPSPGSEIRNEDTEFGGRLLAAGERLYYVPSAAVYHPVLKQRLEKRYHLAWWFAKGRADVREFGVTADTIRIWGIPVRLFARGVKMAVLWSMAAGSSHRFALKVKLWNTMGAVRESFELRRS